MADVKIIGGGLAGCEAAWQLAKRGFTVELYEMRPEKLTPAHKTGFFAELVCSNSLGSENRDYRITGQGILKEELELLDSLILSCAKETRVPAGGALAVDRDKFAGLVTEKITSNNKITVIRKECEKLPRGLTIIASGPLTGGKLAANLKVLADQQISFYDAVAPVVTKESIDMKKAFVAGRYGHDEDYINCAFFTKKKYSEFYEALIKAERHLPHDFEQKDAKYFRGCMPIEVIAASGFSSMRFGPLKPVGIVNPKTGKDDFYAIVQLRQDNSDGTLYNLVGFQTGLKWGEQKRVFSMIPGLEHAEFVRFGVMHRNTSVNAPAVLDEYLRLKKWNKIFIAGQLVGVEGYMESTAMGLVTGIHAARTLANKELPIWPRETGIGSLMHYLQTTKPKSFQPMNVNLGIFPALPDIKDRDERAKISRENAINAMREFVKTL